jgi:hypothetical protein
VHYLTKRKDRRSGHMAYCLVRRRFSRHQPQVTMMMALEGVWKRNQAGLEELDWIPQPRRWGKNILQVVETTQHSRYGQPRMQSALLLLLSTTSP